MSKFAMERKTVHDKAHEEQVKHKHVPGVAYEIADPATKLIFTIGGGFFNEPKYYDTNRSHADFMAELATTGKISTKIVDEMGLTEQAREVIETATAVANGDNPEDLLVIASWARDKEHGLRLRTTPQIMLAIAAAVPKARPFVPVYGPTIMARADEIRQVFAAYRHLFMRTTADDKTKMKHGRPHRGGLPWALRHALAVALARTNDYALLKYDGDERPTFGDLLKMLQGKCIRKKVRSALKADNALPNGGPANWPLSNAMFEYLVNRKIVDGAPLILQLRQKFFGMKPEEFFAQEQADQCRMINQAGLTWENVLSHLGSSKQTWELVIPQMSEMALTRNLRNFEQAKISDGSWEQVYDRLLHREESVQLPFRWFSAHREVSTTEAKSVVGLMLDKACAKVPDLPGVTVAFTDNSGSAVGCAVSGKSGLRVADCGNILEAVLAKRLGRRAKVAVFGDMLVWVPFSQADSCMAIKEKIDACAQRDDPKKYGGLGHRSGYGGGGVGGGTETGLWWGLTDLIENRVKVDRIIIMSDFCCYTQGNAGLAYGAADRFKGQSIQSLCDLYRRTVNKDVFVYSINLNGHGQAQTRPSEGRTYLLSGWSEKIVDIIRECEGGPQAEAPVEVPALEVLRVRYRRTRP